MKNLAENNFPSPSAVSSAIVRGILENEFILQDEQGKIHHARRAVSCLIEPRKGDLVLFSLLGANRTHILAVLEREDGARCQMKLRGDVDLQVLEGTLNIVARDGMKLGSSTDLAFLAPQMEFGADTCEMSTGQLNLLSDSVQANLNTAKISAQKLQSFVGNAIEHFVSRYTRVEGLDQLSARSIRNVAKDVMSLKSKFAFLKAKKNVKIDGSQIFMG